MGQPALTPPLHLARLSLNVRSRDVRWDLTHIYDLHLRVEALCFPWRSRARVLWRLESGANGGLPYLLIQGPNEFDYSRLPTGYLATVDDDLGFMPVRCVEFKRIDRALSGLQEGMALRYRLRANATTRGGERQNVGVRGLDAHRSWLQRQGSRYGFEVVQGSVDIEEVVQAWKPAGAKRHRLVFGSALFEGRLQVTDPDALRAAVINGIGRGRAFGFGLLSLGRAE